MSSTSQPQCCHLRPSCLSFPALPRPLEGQAAVQATLHHGEWPHLHLETPHPISQPLPCPHKGSFLSRTRNVFCQPSPLQYVLIVRCPTQAVPFPNHVRKSSLKESFTRWHRRPLRGTPPLPGRSSKEWGWGSVWEDVAQLALLLLLARRASPQSSRLKLAKPDLFHRTL